MLNMYILVRLHVDSWDSWKKMATSVFSVNPLASLPEISNLPHQPGFGFKFPKR